MYINVLTLICLQSPSLQEMNEDHHTPKKEKQERLSKHKENLQHSQAEEEAHLLGQQRVFYDRNCRGFKRKVMIKRHEFEQEQIREVRCIDVQIDISNERQGGVVDVWRIGVLFGCTHILVQVQSAVMCGEHNAIQ